MGKKVNVVLWDGRTVSVPEEDAAAITESQKGSVQSQASGTAHAIEQQRASDVSGVGNTIAAGVEGGLDTLSFGAYGKLLGDEKSQARAQEHPIARGVGELAAFVVPGSELGAPGIARGVGEAVGGGKLGMAAEGAVLGLGAHVAQSNVTGDPLTIEGFAEDAGLGAILNMGIGAIGDKLRGAAKTAQAAQTEASGEMNRVKGLAETAGKGKELFSTTPDSYKSLREAQAAEDASRIKSWKDNETAHTDYQEFLDSHEDFGKLRDQFNRAQNKIRETYVQPKRTAAFYQSNAKLTDAIDRAGEVVDALEERFAPEPTAKEPTKGSYPGQTPEPEAAPKEGSLAHLVGQEQPASDTAERLKGYKEALSRAYQKKGGGWANDAGKWVRVEGTPADPAGALEDLRQVQADMMTRYPKASGWLRDLPPAVPPKVTEDQARMAGEFLQGMDKKLLDGEQLWRGGRKDEALGALSDVGRNLHEVFPDVPVPDLPEPPRGPRYPRPMKTPLPTDLEGFARMQADTVGRLGQYLRQFPEAATNGQVARLAQDLGLDLGRDAGETLVNIHGSLGRYTSAIDGLETEARKAAMERAAASGSPKSFLESTAKTLKQTAAYGAGRKVGMVAASAMGMPGMSWLAGAAIGRLFTHSLAGAGDALDGALVAGKQSMSSKLQNLVARYGMPTGGAVKALGPVTSWLANSIPDGQRDPERDLNQLAAHRIQDVLSLAHIAPDAGYSAVDAMGMLGHPGDVGMKLQQHAVMAAQHLAATAPKDPGTDHTIRGSDWKPAIKDAIAFAHRLEAVLNPLAAIARLLSGDGHPAAAQTLHAVWPAITQRAVEELALNAGDLDGMTYEGTSGASMLLGAPMSGLQEPAVTLALQGLYLPKPQPPQASPRPSSGRAVGRPAAVQSQVAGSNVGSLIS